MKLTGKKKKKTFLLKLRKREWEGASEWVRVERVRVREKSTGKLWGAHSRGGQQRKGAPKKLGPISHYHPLPLAGQPTAKTNGCRRKSARGCYGGSGRLFSPYVDRASKTSAFATLCLQGVSESFISTSYAFETCWDKKKVLFTYLLWRITSIFSYNHISIGNSYFGELGRLSHSDQLFVLPEEKCLCEFKRESFFTADITHLGNFNGFWQFEC